MNRQHRLRSFNEPVPTNTNYNKDTLSPLGGKLLTFCSGIHFLLASTKFKMVSERKTCRMDREKIIKWKVNFKSS